jgi:hypothetical protein
MILAHVETHPEEGSASITVLASNAPESNGLHDQMIRNIYRAARTVFSNDNTLTHATVMVQTSTNQAESRQLLTAEIDRDAALQANPEQDDLSALESRLRLR